MAKEASKSPAGRKRQWFARRQVYLRTGQDSQYVELSPLLQIGTAIGFLALALWLVGASYGAITGYLGIGGHLGKDGDTDLIAELSSTQQTLADVERERDDAREDASRLVELETALAAAEKAGADGPSLEEVTTLQTELEQSKGQVEDLQTRLSESKADQAALQAKIEAETTEANADAIRKTVEESASLHAELEKVSTEVETLRQERDEVVAERDSFAAELSELVETGRVTADEVERDKAILEAAQAEIERLQQSVETTEASAASEIETYKTTIDDLEAERNTISAELTGLRNRDVSDANERYEALLKAAQAEIERLQTSVNLTGSEATEGVAAFQETIDDLQSDLGEALASKTTLEETVDQLNAELEQVKTTNDETVKRDAEQQAELVEAEEKEAELLAMIDDLRTELEASGGNANSNSEPAVAAEAGSSDKDEEIRELKERVSIAESEVERLIFSRLKEAEAAEERALNQSGASGSIDRVSGDPAETKRLKSELLTAQSDIIKLNADVKAARQRLSEQADVSDGQTARPDNSAKLQQQLASTRSQVQQLNKALASAKLREVAIDLALINVLPTPSPPAPR